ncbi:MULTISPECIES: type II toxin-antitoxin system HicB family antitoxin [Paenibacillus]|nr:type II toxin-antitoxin system HicB family antitoxin [Paenibacillus borealis]
MKTDYVYPVVAAQTETNLSMYFPDFPGTAVTAIELTEGLALAKELLAFLAQELEESGTPLPNPSEPEQITLEDSGDRIVYVEVFMPPFRDAAGLNFSQVLQSGLKDALGIDKQHV